MSNKGRLTSYNENSWKQYCHESMQKVKGLLLHDMYSVLFLNLIFKSMCDERNPLALLSLASEETVLAWFNLVPVSMNAVSF